MWRTVVMIHPGALGDVLLAVPAMRRLRNRFPDHRLVLCAGVEVSTLLAACGIIDEWISWQASGSTCLFLDSDRLTPQWDEWLSHCDCAVGWLQDAGGTFASRLTSFGARQAVVRSPFSDDLQAVHQADRFLEIIGEDPVESAEGLPQSAMGALRSPAKVLIERYGLSDGSPLAVIHPGSGSPAKCVEPCVLVPVVGILDTRGATPLIVEGPADQDQVERLLEALPNRPCALKELDLIAVAGLLTQSALFIGHDSGLTHLAALVGTPTIALFGPTDPDRWAPRGAQVTVLNGGPSFDLQQGQLLSACMARLNQGVLR